MLSCRNGKIIQQTVPQTLPEKYAVIGDSNSASPENWRKVFFDEDLISLIDSALKNNYDLKATLQKVEMAKAGLRFTKGIRLPDVTLNSSAGQRKYGDYTMDGVGNYDTKFSPNINEKQQIPNPLPDYYVGFQSSWEIDLWGKLKNQKKAAAARFIASQYGKDLIITNLIAEVATSYFELLALDNEAAVLTDNIELQQAALELVDAQKSAGRANELGVEMMTAQLLNSKAISAEIKQRVLETESKLNFLCGTFPKSIRRDTSYFSKHINSAIVAGIPSDLLRNRADIRQAEFDLRAADANLKAAQLAFYPNLTLNAALGIQSFNAALLLELPASLAYNTVGGLAAPLLNRRKLKADLMAGKAEQKQAYINYEKVIVNSFKEVYVALNNINNTSAIFNLKKEEVDVLRKSILTSSELYRAGRANYLEVITSQKNSLLAQMELINYYKRQNLAIVDLYRSLGGGWK